MITPTGTAAPALAADAFVRGEKRRCISLTEFRGILTGVPTYRGNASPLFPTEGSDR